MEQALRVFSDYATQLAIPLSAQQRTQCRIYIETLLLWRQKTSLTTAATPMRIMHEHITDSLPVAQFAEPGACLADLGSGAGFPGIPVAIVAPSTEVHLIEPRRKRANFLREVVRKVQLSNTVVHEGRAEDIARQSPQHYDVTVARAVWDTATLLAVSADLLRPQGRVIAMHSTQQHATAPQNVPHYTTGTHVPYTLPHGVERALTVYTKA